MKLEIKKERDTPLLSRKRVTLMAEYEGATPSRLDVKKEVAKKVSAKENLVIIKHIYTRFGSQKSKIIAHVYSDEAEMKKLENDSLLVKHSPKKKKEGEGAEAEAKPEAPKAEEKKEEPKPEEKKEEAPAEKKEEPKEEKKE
ncbi:30S ribosomal protein S24e [candidate division KSB1 bacterium]